MLQMEPGRQDIAFLTSSTPDLLGAGRDHAHDQNVVELTDEEALLLGVGVTWDPAQLPNRSAGPSLPPCLS